MPTFLHHWRRLAQTPEAARSSATEARANTIAAQISAPAARNTLITIVKKTPAAAAITVLMTRSLSIRSPKKAASSSGPHAIQLRVRGKPDFRLNISNPEQWPPCENAVHPPPKNFAELKNVVQPTLAMKWCCGRSKPEEFQGLSDCDSITRPRPPHNLCEGRDRGG